MDGDVWEHVPPHHALGLASPDLMLPPPTAQISTCTSWPHMGPSFPQAGKAPPNSPETSACMRGDADPQVPASPVHGPVSSVLQHPLVYLPMHSIFQHGEEVVLEKMLSGCRGGTNVLVLPSPSSYLGEPLLVDMVHHHNLVIKRSTRPSGAAEGGNQLCYKVQVIYICANSYYPWRAILSLLLNSQSKAVKAHPSGSISLGPALPAASLPPCMELEVPGPWKVNPGLQTQVTSKIQS